MVLEKGCSVKRAVFLMLSLFGIGVAGFIINGNTCTVIAAEEKVVPHEGVIEPTKMLMDEIAKRMSNILEGIIGGSFKYVGQEAGAVVDQSYKINQTFFPIEAKENPWFKRAKIDPGDKEKIEKLKEEFNGYLKEITAAALEIQKAAAKNDQKATFKAFTNMVEKTCFECHEEIREKMIPVENR